MSDPSAVLHAVAEQLERAGALPHEDFLVEGVHSPRVSSEYYRLRADGDHFEASYSDMGRTRVLRRGSEQEVRPLFVERVLELAAGRGRGVGAPSGEPSIPLSELRARRARGSS
jgi:hypothetical protein